MILKNMADLVLALKANENIMGCIRQTVRHLKANGCEANLCLEIGAVFDEAVSEDMDLEEFLDEMNWSIAKPIEKPTGQPFVHLLEPSTGLAVVLPYEDVQKIATRSFLTKREF
jgi:hypothetical protein